MAKKIDIKAHKNHLDQLRAMREQYAELCGTFKSSDGYTVPRCTFDNVGFVARYWHKEYARAIVAKPWNRDPARGRWEKAVKRLSAELRDADSDAIYPHNHWFWNTVLLELAIFLESQKSKPSPMSLFIEALDETVDERVKDARTIIKEAGEVADTALTTVNRAAGALADAGARAWSGAKFVAIVGGSLVGAAIILPPVIRAIRD